MHQTLFIIPHWLLGGWLLVAWIVVGLAILAFLYSRHGLTTETTSFIPIFVVLALVIKFVVPQLEVMGINPADPSGDRIPLGLALQGYGFFMLLGIVSGISLVAIRAYRVGINVDKILSLLFWMVVTGIVGARIFYVVQKREEFGGLSPLELIVKAADMTKGGLVVYGAIIGGTIGAAICALRMKMPVFRVADILGPGMAIGLCFGRIGCLMNGCCFGGVCSPELPNIQFPPGSPPYMQQLAEGRLFGADVSVDERADYPILVEKVSADSAAAKIGLQPQDRIIVRVPDGLSVRASKTNQLNVNASAIVESERMGVIEVTPDKFADQSLGVHPTQIYSAVNAGLLCLVLWFYFPFRKADGEVFALMLILYAGGRFILELIRTDESGQFGSALTISQWVSIVTLTFGLAMFTYLRARGQRVDVAASHV